MEPMKAVPLHEWFAERRESSNRHPCQIEGCPNKSREGKPFCPDHVGKHPYVQEVLQTLASAESEKDRAIRNGARAVDINGHTAHEILHHLDFHGTRSIERLVKDLSIPKEIMLVYVKRLKEKGLVTTRRTGRGKTLVSLNTNRE